ncbi:putative Ig domain-containing protein, partial [Streptomyces sp. NPDC020800]|uniref:putative Ig domain-containing protein n=1 Tax=Streptomyces sp. NPDC020800 TaxID=3365092 RepID=UPI0037A2141E
WGFEETTVPGWSITTGNTQVSGVPQGPGDPVIDCYGGGDLVPSTAPGHDGTAYFQGGSRGGSQMTQTVDVSSASTAIDGGSVTSTLSGHLGGYSSYDDAAKVTATYLNSSGTAIGTASTIGPVLHTERNSNTGMVTKTDSNRTVPAGTRKIKVTVDFTMTGQQNDGIADDISLTLNTSVTAPTLTIPASTVPGYDHVFVVMMENTNYSHTSNTNVNSPGIIGNTSGAPYINNTLLPMGSLLTNYYAGTHNSDPNYEQIAFGNSYGRSQGGNAPSANCITDPACNATNDGLGDKLEQNGKTWLQSINLQTTACPTADSGDVEVDDVPFYYSAKMKTDHTYCTQHWPTWSNFTTDLQSTSTTPDFAWFSGNFCYNMEGCGINAGDTWLSQTLPTLFNSPAWTQQNSLLILTWDEDGTGSATNGGFGPGATNQVATVVVGSQGTVKAGYQASSRYDHYSTARVIEGALGLPSMTNNDKWATPYNEIFTGSQSGGNTVTVTNPGAQSATVGNPDSLQLIATDSDPGQSLTYSATGLPPGLTISSSSGLISGTPTIAGSYPVTATATDSTQAHGSATFTYTVSGSGSTYTVPLANPNAETGTCGSGGGGSAPGWTAVSNQPQQVCYGSPTYPTTAQGPQAPDTPGNAFFDGGPSASSSMKQTIDVSSQATQIATGTLPYTLAGWLGGYSNTGDNAKVVATFQNASGTSLGTATIGPVTAQDRNNQTKLLHKQATGTVPVGTTKVLFTATFTRTNGTDDDGYLDDLSMTFGS